jgi:phage-related tail fiber protein
MHRIDTNGATETGLFQMGNPAIGQQATLVDADWANGVQESLCQAIEAAGITLVKGDHLQLLAAIKVAAQIGGLSAGAIGYFARTTAPTGWLKANGAAVSRTAYAALFASIGTTYGVGDGATTFNLPDARGEFFRALDDGRGIDTGRVLGSAQSSQNLSHQHLSASPGSSTPGGNFEVPPHAGQTVSGTLIGGYSSYDYIGNGGVPTAPTDLSGGTEARPRNLAWLACIKY